MLEMIEKEHVNVLACTPTHYALMLDVREFESYDISSVLYCSMGAAPCPPDLVRQVRERFGCPVLISFGATETAGAATITSIADGEKNQTETVGQTYPGVEVKIVDDNRQEVPRGTVGEVATKMPGVMKGYYKAPEATAKALDGDGWYYTGDLGTMDKKGFVKIVGRKKDMIIRGGQNVYPAEVEAVLIAHAKVREAAVIGVPSELEGETVWAYIVPMSDTLLTTEEILRYSRREMAAYKVPQEIRIVESLPRTPTQKVRKFQLRDEAQQEIAVRLSAVPV
jgi:fatty-acyl-CoA synthase